LRRNLDRARHSFQEGTHDGKAEPGAARAFSVVGLFEGLEDSLFGVVGNSRPGVFSGFLPVLTKLAIASTPFEAISSGYCCDVAPITPALTEATPGQPPSTETISA
jgi:hypothetical protein